ncbi:MAG: FUSC family protein [Hyphomicrobiales bacterium]|nr:FUSC family protein [Hyphomicrobiales bacterium]
MPHWRLPSPSRLLFGQHIVNGVSVGIGVMTVAVAAWIAFGFTAGLPATLGAMSASISDLPAPWHEKARTIGLGFALALVSTLAIQLALAWLPAAMLTIGAIAFAGGMITALGRWAVALGMQAIIPMVFMLGFPRETFAEAMQIELLFASGGVAYIAFAIAATVVTDRSARRLVAAESFREFSIYLTAVAAVFDPETDLEAAYGTAIRQQAALAEQLQSARALLLDRPRRAAESLRLAATIGVLLDAFDALIAAQCDVALLREAEASQRLLAEIGDALRLGALDLRGLGFELLRTSCPTLPPDHARAIAGLNQEVASLEAKGLSGRTEEALVAATRRAILALGHIRRLEKALSDDAEAKASIGDIDLAAFIPRRSYSLRAVANHLTVESPVLRYSVRLALAMMSGSIIAQSLGDVAHGNWVLLTIAVVMRANYGLTRRRRNDRVVGTLAGCVIAAGLVASLPVEALLPVQGIAIAVLQSFVRLDYRIASTAASVSALVSLHLAQPSAPAPVLARLADTLIGAAVAHLFSYVWPHWEFSEAPRVARRVEAGLATFADAALKLDGPDQDYRMARKNMIEALAALSDSAGRMSIEPTAARKGLDEMAALLIAAHGLVAQLSAARLDARHDGRGPDPAVRAELEACLAQRPSLSARNVPSPASPLIAAALAVTEAAERYRRAARIESAGV